MHNQEVEFVHAGESVFLTLKNGVQIGATHAAMVTRPRGALHGASHLHLKHGLTQAEALVQEGASLSHAMKKSRVLESQAIDVIRIGEDTGQLAVVLGKAAARMDTHLTRTIERVTALIQPCLLLLMAVLVGGLVWTMVNIVFSTLSQLNH